MEGQSPTLSLQIFYFFFYIITFFKIIFIETNSSWVIFELSRVLEIETSMLFSLDFASNTILSCFLFFFLIIDLLIFYLLINAVITQIGNPTAELVIPTKTSTKEAKANFNFKFSIFIGNNAIDFYHFNLFRIHWKYFYIILSFFSYSLGEKNCYTLTNFYLLT